MPYCLDNKVRFILMVVNGELVVSNRKKADLIADLEKHGFARMAKSEGKAKSGAPKKAKAWGRMGPRMAI